MDGDAPLERQTTGTVVSKGWNFADVWETVAKAAAERTAQVHGVRRTTWRVFDERADGILARAKHDGGGRQCGASLLDTGVGWMSVFVSSFVASGEEPKKLGSAMAMTAPYELFPASDGAVFIAAGNDRLFARVCGGLGSPGLSDDPRFKTNPDRVRNRAELRAEISALVRPRSVEEVVALLRSAGAPCSEPNSVKDMLAHAQVEAADIFRALPVADHPGHRVVALPVKIDGARGARFDQPPELGADTDDVLGGLGYNAQQLTSLRAAGAIA